MNKIKFSEYIRKSPLYSPDKKVVLYRGAVHPNILFIGEAPGKEENKVGKPFVGRCGKLLDKWIYSHQLERNCGITNTVPLIPLYEGRIRKPTVDEIKYFRPFVKAMLNKYQPKLLILLGDAATTSVLHESIGAVRGKWIDKGPYVITAMYHPSYYLRNGRDGLDDFNDLYKRIILKVLAGVR